MAIIPKQNEITALIEERLIEDQQRYYIGMSALGHPCQRKIWYDFHWAYTPKFTPKQMRIFERGDLEESRVIHDLHKIGMKITSTQTEIVDATGHIRGHIDGLVCGVPGAENVRHLLEIKTMNAARYRAYVKKHDLKRTNHGYYVQINQYMGRMNLNKCLFVVTNKDNEDRDYHVYKFDEQNFKEYSAIGFEVLVAENIPDKIGESTWIECKLCDARGICHRDDPIERNCRTCKYVSIEQNGIMACSYNDSWPYDSKLVTLTIDEQRVGCEHYDGDEAFL